MVPFLFDFTGHVSTLAPFSGQFRIGICIARLVNVASPDTQTTRAQQQQQQQ